MADAKAPAQSAPTEPQATQQVGPQVIPTSLDAPPRAVTHPPLPETRQQQIPVTGIYGPDGRLTHAGMKQVLANGGSVIANGKHVANVKDLPTSADLAQTSEERDAARAQLQKEHQRIQQQLAQLDAGDKSAKK